MDKIKLDADIKNEDTERGKIIREWWVKIADLTKYYKKRKSILGDVMATRLNGLYKKHVKNKRSRNKIKCS